jgi:UDP-glucose 4-epimerase
LDIQDSKLETIFQKERPDYVNHQAAQVNVRRSVADPVFDARVNILGSINVFQNCVKYKVKKVVFASSGGAIYGEQDLFPAPESHPLQPVSPYGITKLVAERYLYYYKKVFDLDYTCLRYANVYGPRQDPFGEAGVVAVFAQTILNGEQPVVNGDGEQTRDFVYVSDVARANLLSMKINIPENVFNIGTGKEISINNIFQDLITIMNSTIKEKHGDTKLGEQRRSCLDSTMASRILNWKPEISIMDGLRNTCQYFQSNVKWVNGK